MVYGERRWRAAQRAGLQVIPCDIGVYSDDDMAELGMLENLQRENLTNYELGAMYGTLLVLEVDGQPKYSIRTLAKRLGKHRSHIEDMLQYARARRHAPGSRGRSAKCSPAHRA